MKSKHLASALVSAALIATPATQVAADAGDFVAGAIIGGIIGANAKKRSKPRAKRVYKSTRQRLPATQEGRQIQASLNYFGFNAGTVDGQLGRKSRNAISNYQAHMGYPVTGQLSDWERDFLFNSYDRAQAGGAATMQTIASLPQGPRGLLHVYREQMAGTTTATAPVTTAVPAAPNTVMAAVPTTPAATATLPSLAAAAPATGGALPNFLGSSQTISLASHCNGISLLTNSNGGFTTVSNMTDPHFALNEQFCLARTYAIAQGEEMGNKLVNFTPAQIAQQCASFGPAMKDQIAAVSLKPSADVVRMTSSFILSTGMSPAEMTGTAKICLSSGYRTDDMDVAIASGLMLVTLGEQVYGELIGHHLSQGFGVSRRPDLAQGWYDVATTALEAGAPAVFAPGQPERTGLLKQAAMSLGGNATAATPQPQPAATLPSFGAASE
jgi:peptidoglycan hydrolase-like protein with peptidoglycan-binding domain